ncbi:MAG TPA: TMEM175 family protein [Streptosporangiaceae bacterium]
MGGETAATEAVSGGGDEGPPAGVGADFESRGLERLALFSDAVIAIAITLLAIELPVPGGDTPARLWASVRHEDGHYAAFLISFLVIAAAWGDHHDLFRCLARIDPRLRTLNSAWLLMVILTPFATRALTVRGHADLDAHALRFGFYALLQVLDSALMLAMVRHMKARRLAPDTPPSVSAKITHESYALMLGFGLSIPLLFAVPYAWVLWLLIPLASHWTRRVRLNEQRRPPRRPAGG